MSKLNKRIEILKPGHAYRVNGANNQVIQEIRFIHKEPIAGSTKQLLRLVEDGTTTEDVLCVLIDRIKHLDAKLSCPENKETLDHLEAALQAQKKRTQNRIASKTIGRHANHWDVKAEPIDSIEIEPKKKAAKKRSKGR